MWFTLVQSYDLKKLSCFRWRFHILFIFRLDEALIKRNVRAASLRFLSPAASDNYIPSSPQHPVTSPHLSWQHGAPYFHNQQPDSPPYTPYTQSIQCNNTVYNSVGANVNYHHYYHHPPTHRPCAYGGSMTSPCQCCPSFQQFFPQIWFGIFFKQIFKTLNVFWHNK